MLLNRFITLLFISSCLFACKAEINETPEDLTQTGEVTDCEPGTDTPTDVESNPTTGDDTEGTAEDATEEVEDNTETGEEETTETETETDGEGRSSRKEDAFARATCGSRTP